MVSISCLLSSSLACAACSQAPSMLLSASHHVGSGPQICPHAGHILVHFRRCATEVRPEALCIILPDQAGNGCLNKGPSPSISAATAPAPHTSTAGP